MLTEKTFDTGAVVINYAESSTDGPPLLILHAVTLNWQTMGELISTLEPHWHVYAPDLRGHGKSGRATTGYRIIDVVPDVTAFIERVIGQPTVVLGYSFGATAAILVAAQLPRLTRALVSLEPGLMLWDTGIEAAVGPYRSIQQDHAILAASRTPAQVADEVKRRMPDLDEAGLQFQADRINRLDPAVLTSLLNDEAVEGFDLIPALREIACPALLVYGEADHEGLVRESDAALFQAHVPHAKLIQIKGVGHAVVWPPASAVMLAHVTQFLESL